MGLSKTYYFDRKLDSLNIGLREVRLKDKYHLYVGSISKFIIAIDAVNKYSFLQNDTMIEYEFSSQSVIKYKDGEILINNSQFNIGNVEGFLRELVNWAEQHPNN